MLHVMHTVWVQDGSSKLVFMKTLYQSAYAGTSVFACVHKHDDCDLPPVQMYNGKQVAFQHAFGHIAQIKWESKQYRKQRGR